MLNSLAATSLGIVQTSVIGLVLIYGAYRLFKAFTKLMIVVGMIAVFVIYYMTVAYHTYYPSYVKEMSKNQQVIHVENRDVYGGLK